MNEADALDLFQAAIWTVLVSAGPAVAAAMIVGLVIALFQALTQVQEATLTFVPKIVAVLVTIGISAPFVGSQISIFTNLVFSLDMENEIMGAILNDGEEPKAAAMAWLKKNPDAATPWLAGVTTFDGGDAAAAVKTALGGSRGPGHEC